MIRELGMRKPERLVAIEIEKYIIVRMRVIYHELKLMVEGIRETYILSPVSWEDSRKP